jgi:hypothetical protein
MKTPEGLHRCDGCAVLLKGQYWQNDKGDLCQDCYEFSKPDEEIDKEIALKDLKEALGSNVKPDITHVRSPLMVYCARACEYGSDKYERANFLRPVEDMRAAFLRYRAYLRACVGHLMKNLDDMERHQSVDPRLEDTEGMKRAAFAADNEAGQSFPASGLPHVSHACASLNMAVTQAVDSDLLPADPGQPWKDKK